MKITTYTLKTLNTLPLEEGYKFRLGGKYWEVKTAENEKEACFHCDFRKRKECLVFHCINDLATSCSVQFYICSIPKPVMPKEYRKEYHKKYAHEYYEAHKEEFRERGRKWVENNRERHREYNREYKREHRRKRKVRGESEVTK